jgi:hypothetical protein
VWWHWRWRGPSPLVGAQFFAGREEDDAGVGAVDAVEDLLHRELTATRVGHPGGWGGEDWVEERLEAGARGRIVSRAALAALSLRR